MKLTSDQIKAIRAAVPDLADKLEAGESVTVEREVKRWIPKPFFYDQSIGSIESAHCRKLIAYREEFASGYVVPEIGERTYSVVIENGKWVFTTYTNLRHPTGIYMPCNTALELARKLNSGEVVL